MNDHISASQLLRDAARHDDFPTDVDRIVRGGISRGRALRRRRRVGTSLAAATVVGAIGVAASVGPGLLGERGTAAVSGPGFATDGSASPSATPTAPTSPAPTTPPRGQVDAHLAVAAADVPAVFGDLLGGQVGDVRDDETFPLIDEKVRKTVHFTYEGTLATFVVERADNLAPCAALVDPANQPDGQPGGECVVRDGVELLLTPPEEADGVTAQGVSAWRHGYVVSVVSYNAAYGKEVSLVTDVPPISMADLERLVTSDVWFTGAGEPGARSSSPEIAVTAGDVPALVAAVVPGEVYLDEPSSDDGSAVVARFRLDELDITAGITVADGDPMTRCRDDEDDPRTACRLQRDGSVLLETSSSSGRPAGRLDARTLVRYLSGFTITVSSDGSRADVSPLTRAGLVAIVTSPGWITGS